MNYNIKSKIMAKIIVIVKGVKGHYLISSVYRTKLQSKLSIEDNKIISTQDNLGSVVDFIYDNNNLIRISKRNYKTKKGALAAIIKKFNN